ALKAEGYCLALATSSTSSVDLVIDGLGLRNIFDVIVSGHDVVRPKPDPEIFVLTAQKLGVSPAECLVLEDSAAGVEAAQKAGMRCIAIPSEATKGQDFSQADLIIESLAQIKLALIEGLANT
ncbi:MAG: HAD-IA family hydrolase, partial [Chloroflexi bacterium]|nr:HAD-IA family hydrolase [Chloroflexota bacterium]